MGIINFTMPTSGNFLVEIIIWLVKISSSVALGIVLFTLILKLITLPFDYFSRSSMRKNSLKMEEMRPELEKLQKQYADNKDLYNQKMMALYKKNGYSMFGSCLPTILTLVIFIVAINAFTEYSQYQNKMDFYEMSKAYNSVVYSGFETDDKFVVRNEKGELIIATDEIKTQVEDKLDLDSMDVNYSDTYTIPTTNGKETGEIKVDLKISIDASNQISRALVLSTEKSYIDVILNYEYNENSQLAFGRIEYLLSNNAVNVLKNPSANILIKQNNLLINSEEQTFEQAYNAEKARIEKLNQDNAQTEGWQNVKVPTEEQFVDTFLNDIQSFMSAKKYKEVQSSFLWIKNIWVTDSPMKNPVEKSWSSFKQTHGYSGTDIGDNGYNKLIAGLKEETTQPNGYFILVILTAGVSLLSQIVMGKSQKAQMELQTVDGQGAQTQKMMQWMMPIMMAVFAFMYTSAFSIYIILSSIIGIGTTFLINFIVDLQLKKENKNKQTEKVRGRIHTPAPEQPKKEEKKKNKNQPPENDFLSGKAGKGHIRGRIK